MTLWAQYGDIPYYDSYAPQSPLDLHWANFNLSNLSPADFNLSTADPDSEDIKHIAWFDGSNVAIDFLTYDEYQSLLSEFPELVDSVNVTDSGTALTLFQGSHLIQSQSDRDFMAGLETIAGKYTIGKQKASAACPKILKRVKELLPARAHHF
jgi:hypothetical protein